MKAPLFFEIFSWPLHAETTDLTRKESVGEFFSRLLHADFMPHGHCFWWRPDMVWLHAISDGLIFLAYFSIPLMLVYFAHKRKDIPYQWVFPMFGAFIFSCGTGHLIALITMWEPVYRLEGAVKAITAGVSVVTAIVLYPLIPKMLSLRSPKELEAVNSRARAFRLCRFA
jgi:hypothetical protein